VSTQEDQTQPISPSSALLLKAREDLGVDDLILWVRHDPYLVTAATTVYFGAPHPVDLPIGSGVAGTVFQRNERTLVPDLLDVATLAREGLALRQPELVETQGWRSGLFVPLSFPPRTALIGAYSRKPGGVPVDPNTLEEVGERALLRIKWEEVAERPLRLEEIYNQITDYLHDIRQFADTALMNVQGARDGTKSADLHKAIESLTKLTSLCEAPLRNVALAPKAPRLINMSRLIEEVLKEVSGPFRQADIQIQSSIPERVPAFVNEQSFRRALMNILKNARHHLTTSRRSRLIEVSVSVRDGLCVVIIRDNGPGIQPDRIPRIFEPGVSYSSSGYGIGLAQVESAVSAVGGTVRVSQNTFGQGVSFELVVPTRRAVLQ